MTTAAECDDRSLEQLLASLTEHLDAGDARAVGADLGYLGREATAAGKHKLAILYYESALTVHRGLGDGWGAFLDLSAQAETILSLERQLPGALAGLYQAFEIAREIEAPEAEQAEGRYESILRQVEERFPSTFGVFRRRLREDPESLRTETIYSVLEDPALSLGFFDDQLIAARALDEPIGVVSSLGSQAQVLADCGEAKAAAAALVLAEAAAASAHEAARPQLADMLGEWSDGVADALGGGLEGLRDEIAHDPEHYRAEAVARIRPR